MWIGQPYAAHLRRAFLLLLSPFKKYYTQAADQEDLICSGTIGLIKGITTFDHRRARGLQPMQRVV